MNKYNLLLIISFIPIIIFISGCTYNTNNNTNNCGSMVTNQTNIYSQLKEAVQNPKICDCINYSVTSYPANYQGQKINADYCYEYAAISSNNSKLCDNIKDSTPKKECNYKINSYNLSFTNLSECQNVPNGESVETCYQSVAKKVQNISSCNDFPDAYKYICYDEFAVRENDPSICEQYFKPLTDDYIRQESENITNEAKASGKPMANFNPLDYISNRYVDCYDTVGIGTNNTKVCKSARCITIIAYATNDKEKCNEINTANLTKIAYHPITGEQQLCIGYINNNPINRNNSK